MPEELISLNWVVPFSDPVADGPTIQKADERALAAGTTPDTVFEIVREIRKESDIPIVFLTYYNIVYRRGIERFYQEAQESGVDGILISEIIRNNNLFRLATFLLYPQLREMGTFQQ